jgi:hypothetical protein
VESMKFGFRFRRLFGTASALTLLGVLMLGSAPAARTRAAPPARGCASVTPNGILNGVAALSATDVWTVGSHADCHGATQALVEHWNGSQWTFVPSPGVTSDRTLAAVAALSSRDIWAVGFQGQYGNRASLAEHWNGRYWRSVLTPNIGTDDFLQGVSAVSSTDVWAVGYYVDADGNYQTLIERWNGKVWVMVHSPSPSRAFNWLRGIAALSPTDIWAVGTRDNWQGLIEHWNGAKWSVTPNHGGRLNGLAAVRLTKHVLAAGSYLSPGIQRTRVERWNGRSWDILPSPSPGPEVSSLLAVAAASPRDVWATGYHGGRGDDHPLIEHRNGRAWEVAPIPTLEGFGLLYGVSAVSAKNVWAVGGRYQFKGACCQTLIEHWNGSIWSVASSPNP